jgi:phage terminase large subunit-like protein
MEVGYRLGGDGSQIFVSSDQVPRIRVAMAQEGLPMVEVGATVRNFSEAMKEIEARILSQRLLHDGNPVLTWMASNVICHYDKKDNVFPNKEKPEKKIDGIVALIMAGNRMMAPPEDRGTVYDRRGVISG